ncbi:MAG: hypothetical protein V7739_19835 [Motiliproteus sp.]
MATTNARAIAATLKYHRLLDRIVKGGNLNQTSRTGYLYKVLLFSTLVFQLGCATPISLPDGTRSIGEVAHVLSRQEILTGDINEFVDNRNKEQIKMPVLHESLLDAGLTDEEIVDGSVVLNRVRYSRFNVTSGIVRQSVNLAIVPKGSVVAEGNVVEVEQIDGLPVVVHIRYKNLTDGKCVYRLRDPGSIGQVFDALNPIGGPGEASLYCPEIEKEGWYPVETTRGVQWFSKPPEGS